ncbi:MAG: thiol peroxidase [Bdellovibrionales bacterium]|nr:thiol peroxidase [Bdellovibrionales bacterium]
MTKDNSKISFKGKPLEVAGESLQEGQKAPDFKLTAQDLTDLSGDSFKGKVLVISTVPSLDTPTCHAQTLRFNKEAAKFGDKVTVLSVSRDLPFAQNRWCEANSVSNVEMASDYKYQTFGESFGVLVPSLGLLARAVFVINQVGEIVYLEYVEELSSEPDYDGALSAIEKLL